ncbi:indole-3-glycerol phosphate synthase TrpC [Liquorilactobacillus sicerae]|uniref:indole-3-glycerol phosphate synthase TrpC n=1 Tax=Liquorilactobacillus sicerae TaxID=1416943 RepID=UPI002480E004|nr:indole-3-glycerol phosphate synthase TrpC [Liquorilactobacillus sicerae]
MILDELAAATAQRLHERQKMVPLQKLQQICDQLSPTSGQQQFEADLRQPELSIIAEIKQASPSKGLIVKQLPYLQIAQAYEQAKVSAISILTEEDHFKGNLQYLTAVAAHSQVPLLRKDFTIDPYMIYEAKAAGAAIILLITVLLTDQQLAEYLALAEQLQLAAIVEVHNRTELTRALATPAKIIGINNRDLTNFKVDLKTTITLSSLIPKDRLVISESGIHSAADVARLKAQTQINGILVGEYLMRAPDKATVIKELRTASDD